ncbi:MAG TPA: FAD-dependent oxidoreductase [Geobacterales bacterium]|nr:FAD-dependent oxidoreductase [Geobacterales bacterium]
MNYRYLILGGGISGFYAAQSIREKDKEGALAIISQESTLPYDRTVLSKGYLEGRIKRESIFLKKQDFYDKNKIELILGKSAVEIDPSNKRVKLNDGNWVHYEKLLIATGGTPRRLKIEGSDLKGVFHLRSLADCDMIKDWLSSTKKAVIIGGGFIGCEVASVLAKKNIEVTMLELTPHLLSRVLDEEMSIIIENFLKSKGVKIYTNTSASRIIGENGKIKAVETNNGEVIEADFALIGVGINPNVDLARNAGIKVDNGVITNEFLETSVQDIYAAGDIAMFYSPIFKKYMRVEHYDVAVKHGKIAGKNMAGERQAFDELPYFFSRMAELSVYVYGELNNKFQSVRRGEIDLKTGFLKFYFDNSVLNSVLAVNTFKDLNVAKELIKKRFEIKDIGIFSREDIDLGKFLYS